MRTRPGFITIHHPKLDRTVDIHPSALALHESQGWKKATKAQAETVADDKPAKT